jgi:hypothetical protein
MSSSSVHCDEVGIMIHPPHQDHPAVHGMLVFGQQQILLSHLPMFHAPHDFQVLLQVRMRSETGDPEALYRQDRSESGEKVYTWVPQKFVLQDLFTPPTPLRLMTGTLFRGHFERGGTPITSDSVTAEVVRVLHGQRFTPGSEAMNSPRYLLVGSAAEPFLVHLITQPPDFDQVIAVQLAKDGLNFNGGALVLEIPDRKNGQNNRLREGESVQAVLASDPGGSPLQIAVGTEVYFETGDLAS